MRTFRASLLIVLSALTVTFNFIVPKAHAEQGQQPQSQPQQKLVEGVDVVGNRRLRDDDILYWVQTRPGDTYNPEQVQRDLAAINQLGFFDKTASRVLTEDGAR